MKSGINNVYGSALRNTLGARFNFLEGRTRQAHGWIGGVFTIKRISGVGGSFRRSCYGGLHCDVSDPGIHPLLAIHTCLITVSALCCSFPPGLKFEASLVLWLACIVQWLEGYQGLSTCARVVERSCSWTRHSHLWITSIKRLLSCHLYLPKTPLSLHCKPCTPSMGVEQHSLDETQQQQQQKNSTTPKPRSQTPKLSSSRNPQHASEIHTSQPLTASQDQPCRNAHMQRLCKSAKLTLDRLTNTQHLQPHSSTTLTPNPQHNHTT